MTLTQERGHQKAPAPGRIQGAFDMAIRAMNAAGTVWIIVLMLLINADIFGRSLLNAPLKGVPELVVFSIVGIVFLQLAHTLRTGSMIRSDAVLGILERSAPRVRRALLCLFHLVGGILFGVVGYKFWPTLVSSWSFPARFFMGTPGVFSFPYWPIYLVMMIGIAATFLQFIILAIDDLRATFGSGHRR